MTIFMRLELIKLLNACAGLIGAMVGMVRRILGLMAGCRKGKRGKKISFIQWEWSWRI